MTKEQINKYLQQGECETLEFKTSFNKDVAISLNAFANTEGGTAVIGVKRVAPKVAPTVASKVAPKGKNLNLYIERCIQVSSKFCGVRIIKMMKQPFSYFLWEKKVSKESLTAATRSACGSP